MATFAETYSDNPWGSITEKTRTWYVPILLNVWRTRNVFTRFIPTVVDLRGRDTNQVVFSQVYDLEPDTDPVGLRDMWAHAMYTDSNKRSITTEHHMGKVALHKFDDYINYWRRNPGRAGLVPIIRDLLARSIADHMDILARNAFLSGPYKLYCGDASNDGFNDLAAGDLFEVGLLDQIWLGMSYREAPFANNPTGPRGDMLAITSPGVLYDIRNQAGGDFKEAAEYAGDFGKLMMDIEVGRLKATRFIQTTRCTLYNCGPVTVTADIVSSTPAGTGAAATVDGNVTPGQPANTRYVQLDTGQAASFAGHEGEIVTIHKTKTSDYGVSNGVDFTEGSLTNRRLVSVDTDNDRLSFDRPLQKDYDTEVDTGIYGYVTLGRHIHATVCLGGAQGVVAGVTQPPTLHNPPTVDDAMAMKRFSWDAYIKYQTFLSDRFEVVFSAGNVRFKGRATTGG
jgi:hypothetical protein